MGYADDIAAKVTVVSKQLKTLSRVASQHEVGDEMGKQVAVMRFGSPVLFVNYVGESKQLQVKVFTKRVATLKAAVDTKTK